MTPQERQLIDQLFDRLAQLEREPRDAEAERAIRDGLAKAPNAIYALVQTALVQDEALRRAGARIEELQEELANAQQHQAPPTAPADSGGGFLDRMRNTMFGGGSVPSVRATAPDSRDSPSGSGRPMGVPPGYAEGAGAAAGAAPAGGPFGGGGYGAGGYGGPGGGAFGGGAFGGGGGGGGSFLGTAAAAAAGTIGGSLLLNSIRGMMGPAHASSGSTSGSTTQNTADTSTASAASTSPWGSSSSSNSDLAQQAGANDVSSRNDGGQQVSTADDGSQGAYQDHDGGSYQDDGDYDDYDDDGDDGDYV